MTRREQAIQAADAYILENGYPQSFRQGFIDGAQWADIHSNLELYEQLNTAIDNDRESKRQLIELQGLVSDIHQSLITISNSQKALTGSVSPGVQELLQLTK